MDRCMASFAFFGTFSITSSPSWLSGRWIKLNQKKFNKSRVVIKYLIFFPAKQEITNCQIHPSSLKIHYYHYHYHVYHHYHHHHHHHFTLISPCPSRFITTITTFIITITTTTNIIITTATKIITITTLPWSRPVPHCNSSWDPWVAVGTWWCVARAWWGRRRWGPAGSASSGPRRRRCPRGPPAAGWSRACSCSSGRRWKTDRPGEENRAAPCHSIVIAKAILLLTVVGMCVTFMQIY